MVLSETAYTTPEMTPMAHFSPETLAIRCLSRHTLTHPLRYTALIVRSGASQQYKEPSDKLEQLYITLVSTIVQISIII